MKRWQWWPIATRPYVFTFTLRPQERCHHVNRLGWQCFRPMVWDYWCGMHNGICDNLSDSSKHDRTHKKRKEEK